MPLNKDILYPSGHYFSAKEFTFLNTDIHSEKETYVIPDSYLSDLFLKKNNSFKSFMDKIEAAGISTQPFSCVVMKCFSQSILEKDINPIISNSFSSISNHGKNVEKNIWAFPASNTFILAAKGNNKTIDKWIDAVQQNLSKRLKCPVSSGKATFPYFDFSWKQTIENAVKAFDHAAFFKPGKTILFNDVSLNISGDRQYQMNRLENAVNEYKNGLKLNPVNINLINSLGVCFSIMNHLELAREAFENALAIDRTDIMATYNAGLTCDFMNDLSSAVEYLKKASALNNGIYEIELTAGIIMFKADLFTDALKHFKKASTLNAESTMALRMLGEIYLRTAMPHKAAPWYKKAIKGNPRDAAALSGLARAYEIQNKNLDIALDLAAHSLVLAPDNPIFRSRIGKIYLKKGLYDTAGKEFIKAGKVLDKMNISTNERFIFKQSALPEPSTVSLDIQDKCMRKKSA